MTMRRSLLRLVLGLAVLTPAARQARAQSVRIRSTTTARYAQLRPIEIDTATRTFRAMPVASATPVTQDIELSAWELGVPGLRAYGLFRGRAALGSELVWPRSDDHFDAMVAFLELERLRYRLRAGRQHRASGLGWYAFDGLTATWRPRPTVRTEVYGGWGFGRGFLEPAGSSLLRSLDPLRPDRNTLLAGASIWVAPSPASELTATYQRELLSDRSALVSERAAFDARVAVGSKLLLTGTADADLATAEWGRARIGVMARLNRRSFVQLEGFRYKPILDLTTIWGAFSPEANHGLAASARFSPSPALFLSTAYTYRTYEPVTNTTPFLSGVGDDSQQLTLGARVARGDLSCEGSYHLLLGFGGAQSGGDVQVGYGPPDTWRLALRATAFQQEEMFRVSDGTVFGFGAEGRGRIGDRFAWRAEAMRYRHRRQQGQAGADWSQTRAMLTFEWIVGANADRRTGVGP